MNNNINILVVDDDPIQVMAISALLKSEGYTTYTARSACETLEIIKSARIDIVLLDINLGDDNGIQLLPIIKPKEMLNNPFVILISGYEYDNYFIEKAVKEGADGYIQKPYAEELLLARIRILARVKSQEEELVKTRHQLETIIESSLDGILVINNNGNIVFANRSAEIIFGRKKDELINRVITSPPFNDEPVEAEVLKPNNDTSIVDFRFSPINWGNEPMSLVTIRDITEMSRVRSKLRDSEVFYRKLTEKNLDGILFLDADGKITYCPTGTCTPLETECQKITGQNFIDFIHSDFYNLYKITLAKSLDSPGSILKLTWKYRTKSFKEVWFEGYFQNLLNDPVFNSILVNFRDITDITQSKEELKKMASETRLIYEAGRILNQSLNPEEIFDRFYNIVSGIMEVDDMVITSYDKDKGYFSFKSVWDNGIKQDVSIYPKMNMDTSGKGMQSRAVLNDKAFIINDYVKAVKESNFVFVSGRGIIDPHKVDYSKQAGAKSAIICPLHSKDSITGVLQVFSYNFNAYTETDMRILQALSNNLAVVMINASLYENIQNELAERKKIESELRLSEERFNAFMRNLPANAWISDKEHKILFDNNNLKRTKTDYPGGIIGKTPYDIIEKDIAEKYIKNSSIVLQTGEPIEVIEPAYLPDGTLGSFLVYKFPVYTPEGEFFVGGISLDITQRIKQEEELKAALKEKKSAEERFRQFMEHVPAIAWITDKNHNIIYANKILFKLKIKGKNIINRNIKELFDECSYNEYIKNSQIVLETGKGIEVIEKAFRQDGSQGSFLVYKFPLKSPAGEVLLGAIAIDITERLEMENNLKAGIYEKENLLREIHHRVKNNLQIINSLLSLQSQVSSNEPADFLTLAQNRIRSMALIHDQLYSSSSLNNIDFNKYAQQLLSHLFSIYDTGIKKIAYEIISDNIQLDVETAIPIGLITNELVTNSLKYAFRDKMNGKIEIRMERYDDQQLKLTICDNGNGLPEDINLHNLNSLGLNLVEMLVSQLEGSIEMKKQKGAEFVIIFKKVYYKPRLYS